MNAKIATFTNTEDGVEAFVLAIDFGFRVLLKDLDSGENLSSWKEFPHQMKDQAIATAKSWANVKP